MRGVGEQGPEVAQGYWRVKSKKWGEVGGEPGQVDGGNHTPSYM